MEYNHFLKNCRDDDVISLSKKMYKLGQIKDSLNNFIEGKNYHCIPELLADQLGALGIRISEQEALTLLTEGIDSEILKISSGGWQKGKLKINVSVEFIPEEPEIPEY